MSRRYRVTRPYEAIDFRERYHRVKYTREFSTERTAFWPDMHSRAWKSRWLSYRTPKNDKPVIFYDNWRRYNPHYYKPGKFAMQEWRPEYGGRYLRYGHWKMRDLQGRSLMILRYCPMCQRLDCAEFLCGTEFDVPDFVRYAPDYDGSTYEESVQAL